MRTAGGRTFGVLAISSNPPLRALSAEDLRTIEVFARLAALALERSELLEREAGLRREEGLLNRALQAVAASIDLEAVYRAIVEQAARAVRRHHGHAHPLRPGPGRAAPRRRARRERAPGAARASGSARA